ncbi:MAG: flippase [Actinobacteria bacterium]|nr:flippase [Actinomycetota bacterium]
MSSIKTIAKNTSALYIGQFVASFLAFILSIYIARLVGNVDFGKYSFAIAFSGFFMIFSDLGYHTFLFREVSKNRDQAFKYLSNIITIRIILTAIFFGLLVLLINIMGYPENTKNIVYLFGASTLITSFASVFKMIFRAFEKMEYDAFSTILTTTIRFIVGISILYLGFGLIVLGISFIFIGVLEVLISYILCHNKFVKPVIRFDKYFWKNSIKIALPICLSSAFGLIYIRIDTVMLSLMKGDAVVGWYNAAYNLTLGLTPFPDLFMNALLPIMMICSSSNKNSLSIIYEKAFKYLFIIGLPLAVGTMLLADKLIFFLYGKEYFNSIIALQILAWDILLLFLYRCIYYLLLSINKQNQIMIISGITALINIGLNLFLIPLLGYVGAGISTIITELILLCLFFYVSSKNVYRIPLHKVVIKPIIASIVMGIIIYFLADFNLIIIIIFSIFVYFFILYLTKAITQEDFRMFRSIFNRSDN